jgi:hypothetical protein
MAFLWEGYLDIFVRIFLKTREDYTLSPVVETGLRVSLLSSFDWTECCPHSLKTTRRPESLRLSVFAFLAAVLKSR